MRFLADVNAGGATMQWLAARGDDVVEVASRDAAMEDEDFLRWARAENRVILTTDRDFKELVYRRRLNLAASPSILHFLWSRK